MAEENLLKTQHPKRTPTTPAGMIPYNKVMEITNELKVALKHKEPGKEADLTKTRKYLVKNYHTDIDQFAKSAIYYFKQGLIEWDDFGVLQAEVGTSEFHGGGLDLIPFSYLKRDLEKYKEHMGADFEPPWEQKVPKLKQLLSASFLKKVQGKYRIV